MPFVPPPPAIKGQPPFKPPFKERPIRITLKRIFVIMLYVSVLFALTNATGFPRWHLVWLGLTCQVQTAATQYKIREDPLNFFSFMIGGVSLVFVLFAVLFVSGWAASWLWNWSAYSEEDETP
jgi:hypothetical protein